MNPNQDLENNYDYSEETDFDDGTSVDDFIRQLEAKEKDLHISSDMIIEIDEADFDDTNIPDFVAAEIPPPPKPKFDGGNFPVVPAPVVPNSKTFSELEDDITALKSQVSKMESERSEVFENSRRRQKDFEAYKTRTERERSETFQNQLSNLAMQMLPVLDNMNRAMDFAVHVPDDKTNEFRQFFDGIMLVNQQLNEILSEMGVSPIAAVGEVFDPHLHEAVAVEETEDFPPQTISAELLRGYRIGEKVIRASMVKVATPVKAKSVAVSQNDTNEDLFEIEID
jgi:molecular chaperone GrpE (heat shock protein)